MKINPTVMFDGSCAEAFRRYASVFGGDVVFQLTYAESPLQAPVDGWENKIWFARLRAGGIEITGGDVAAGHPGYEAPAGFSMTADAVRVFAALAADGEVLMPLQETHWSPRYGIVRDAFGIRWEINADAEPAASA